MSNENQKHENQQENEQPITPPAAQVELTDEELEQVTGGAYDAFHPKPQPDPTAVE